MKKSTDIYGSNDSDAEIYKFKVIIFFCNQVIVNVNKMITPDDVKDYIGNISGVSSIQRNLIGRFKGISGGEILREYLNYVVIAAHIRASRLENLAIYHDPSLTDEIYPGITNNMQLFHPIVQHLHMLQLNPMKINLFKDDPVLLTVIVNQLSLLINPCVLNPTET
jgi:hypothetical protein